MVPILTPFVCLYPLPYNSVIFSLSDPKFSHIICSGPFDSSGASHNTMGRVAGLSGLLILFPLITMRRKHPG